MAHPQMFDDDDPVLARLSEICRALPGADKIAELVGDSYRQTAPKKLVVELDSRR